MKNKQKTGKKKKNLGNENSEENSEEEGEDDLSDWIVEDDPETAEKYLQVFFYFYFLFP